MSAEGILPGLQVVAPRGGDPARLAGLPTLAPFSEAILAFAGDLSRAILTAPAFRGHPEAIAFAYWARAARLKQQKAAFEAYDHAGLMAPRGVAFHLAPANVDTIFLYSLMVSLLVGNSNIIRISRRDNALMGALVAVIGNLLDDPRHAAIRERLIIVRYDHDAAITRHLCDLCDLRIIWGGDATINTIRAIPLPPRAVDVCFADKVSLAVINPRAYLAHEDKVGLARAFRNDAYWFGQMACSSPRAVIWQGEASTAEQASRTFWQALEAELIAQDPELGAMDYLNKLLAEQSFMSQTGGHRRPAGTNLATVVAIEDLGRVPFDEHCGGGLFLETRVDALADLGSVLSRRNQTIISFGLTADDWRDYLVTAQPRGIDRIVPFGQALDFNTTWDGMNLFRAFSREIAIGLD